MNEELKCLLEGKRAHRARLAALSFEEKTVLLAKLRDRALAIRKAAALPNKQG
ncbi:MAG: hypothetical protein H7A53_02975 [Akkermansiaceae bacterium]|nr:hypothetical protein [Akkermansiaceae bacterium]MCP5549848.1 hypothetical protein [Akkermansiaceae bacterium]